MIWSNLPADEPLERGLLGCVLSSPLEALPELREHPVEDYLADGRHRLIFLAAQDLAERGDIVAPPTIESLLAERNELFDGAPELIKHLFCDGPASSLAGYYADKLRPLAIRRQQIIAAKRLDTAARQGDDEATALAIKAIDECNVKNVSAESVLDSRLFNPLIRPPTIRPVFSALGVPIATPGNLQSITALAKAGKSGWINAMIAAPMAMAGSDTLGISAENSNGFAVLHFDTEQSTDDHWHQVSRALRRAGREIPPSWLRSYCFTGFSARQNRENVWNAIERAKLEFGGVHSVLIDGIADLVNDVNDPEECNRFVAELHALAIRFDCPITNVIHINPGSDSGKTRGHLGSQLERKSETNLRIDKSDEISEVWSDRQRRAPIIKGKGPRFAWSNDAGMHVTVEPGTSMKEIEERQDAIELRDEVFNGRTSMRHSELESELAKLTKRDERTARRKISKWGQMGIIEKGFQGLLIPRG